MIFHPQKVVRFNAKYNNSTKTDVLPSVHKRHPSQRLGEELNKLTASVPILLYLCINVLCMKVTCC